MNFYDLLETLYLKSVKTALDPDAEALWRAKCRAYSAKFNTPLHLVNDLDPEFVLTNLYELENTREHVTENLEEILDKLYKARDPDYEPMDDEEVEDLVDAVLNKEIKRLGQKPILVAKPKNAEKVLAPIETAEPKSGGLSFDNLNRQDEMSDFGKNGFED